MLIRMAWRNLWRNPRRTAVVVTAISIGIAGCILSMAINLGLVAGMVDTAIRGGLGHMQVHASGWDADPQLDETERLPCMAMGTPPAAATNPWSVVRSRFVRESSPASPSGLDSTQRNARPASPSIPIPTPSS